MQSTRGCIKMEALQAVTKVLFVTSMFFAGTQCIKWSAGLEDGFSVFMCEGEDLTIPWHITLDKNERLLSITWFFRPNNTQKTFSFAKPNPLEASFQRVWFGKTKQNPQLGLKIASYSSAQNEYVPTTFYSKRVHCSSNGELNVSHAMKEDTGNYTVEINSTVDGVMKSERRTAFVQVSRPAAAVRLEQVSEAVYHRHSRQYHIQLTCKGRFGDLPYVTWTTPEKTFRSPKPERDGESFALLLRNPVSGGNYSCHVPSDYDYDPLCPSDDTTLGGATIFVDKMAAHLILVEAEQKKLHHTAIRLEAHLQELRDRQSRISMENYNLQMELYYLKTRVKDMEMSRSSDGNKDNLQIPRSEQFQTFRDVERFQNYGDVERFADYDGNEEIFKNYGNSAGFQNPGGAERFQYYGDGERFPKYGDASRFQNSRDSALFQYDGDGRHFQDTLDEQLFQNPGDGQRFQDVGIVRRFQDYDSVERFQSYEDVERFPTERDAERFQNPGDCEPFRNNRGAEHFPNYGDTGRFPNYGNGKRFQDYGNGQRIPNYGEPGHLQDPGDEERFQNHGGADWERYPKLGDEERFQDYEDSQHFQGHGDVGQNADEH